MSSPILIPQGASNAMSVSSSPSPSSGSPKYVPIHKRAGSNQSSSSRSSSPISARSPSPVSSPGVYSIDALLALRPLADESMKQKIREGGCPEVAMNRRMRKSMQYIAAHPQLRTQPQHTESTKEESAPVPAPSQQRAMPRRNRPVRRALERRRSALQETWKGMRVTVQPLVVL